MLLIKNRDKQMFISVEMSYYPLKEEFKPVIKGFIGRLKANPKLNVESNSMSTKIVGEHKEVMEFLTEEMIAEFEKYNASFILKIIKGQK